MQYQDWRQQSAKSPAQAPAMPPVPLQAALRPFPAQLPSPHTWASPNSELCTHHDPSLEHLLFSLPTGISLTVKPPFSSLPIQTCPQPLRHPLPLSS